ncbi:MULTISPECIES: DUF4232 domain-containing protein [unclassified Streptomyces]|uniref:DUF4232 domain-containing protein n=1 Tax=unclassified Streptomyces TaxID=2593676 RepID=UPI00225787EE|nr:MULTISPECIES: DUF4232 domain-containing protein [unclassified Streptomyces]MCX5139476.1 DUF4232 domain-containing protein [Streptomyces sp. NBC_00338]WRZ64150.1 DUF4232 domain-containing protein [Streptomyces sp. NBC_01257]
MRARAGTGIRGPVTAALVLAGALGLAGCSGFLVPAGEGEPGPSRSPAATGPAPVTPPSPPDIATAPADRPGAPARQAPSPTATGGCPSSGLVVSMGPVEAALGHRAVGLTLTNCGDAPHRVDGYPSVQAVDEKGDALPVKVNPGSSYFGADKGPEEVMLAPGKTMRSLLVWVSTPTGGDLIEGDALEIAPAPGLEARSFPLEGSDVRLLDEFNMTGWRTATPG